MEVLPWTVTEMSTAYTWYMIRDHSLKA